MPVLKGHHKRSKTAARTNPYAERGLDQFALVSAELQETREKLLAQFGTSLSLIRFAVGPDHQTKWIPIIVSQSSSKAEVRALRRAASDLIIRNKHAFEDFDAGNHIAAAPGVHRPGHAWKDDTHLGSRASDGNSRISGNNTHVGSRISKCDAHLGSEVSIESSGVTSMDTQSDVGVRTRISKAYQKSYLMASIQGFIWMLKVIVFSSRIVADIARNSISWRRHPEEDKMRSLHPSKDVSNIIDHPSVDNVRSLRPSKDVINIIDHPSVDRASASSKPHLSYPPPRSIAKDDIKRMKPLPSLNVEAPKTRKTSRFPSAPSTPRASQQLTKPIQACVSFPKTPHFRGLAPNMDIKEIEPVQKTIPSKVMGSSASNTAKEIVSEKERKETMVSEKLGQKKHISERLGQALTGAGLMLVLSGLLMGYIPAIVGVVSWWYMLPSMRRAVGDKPFVRSHHHHSPEDRNANTVNNKARGKHVGSSMEDTHFHEDKKKVSADGVVDHRHRHHSQA